MTRHLLPTVFLILLSAGTLQAQSNIDRFAVGPGIGFDYGGIGVNVTAYPQKNIGIFVGLGDALAGFGYNAGIRLRALPNNGASRVHPFVTGMYGYNAAVAVSEASQYNKLFYGVSAGGGLDIVTGKARRGCLSVALLIPIRNDDAQNYVDELRNTYGVTFNNNLSPVGFSVGYKFSN
jgi:hypothetical protein